MPEDDSTNDNAAQQNAPENPADRAAYLEGELKKWRGRAENSYGLLNSLGVTNVEDATALKDRAAKAESLEHEALSDREKAIAEASKATRSEADSHYRPLLVRARIEAKAAGRIDSDRLEALLEPLDLTKFLTDSGDVDTDKVSAYVNGIAPEMGNGSTTPTPRGPGVPPGRAGNNTGPGSSVQAGRDLWNQLNPNKAIPTT